MKLAHLFCSGLLASAVLVSCKKEGKTTQGQEKSIHQKEDKKRKPLDFSPVKAELKLKTDQEKVFDEITAKFQKIRENNYQIAKQSGKVDRVALGIKNEEINLLQAKEMAKILTPEQMEIFNRFVSKNSRKRPRYSDELLAKIQQKAGLSEEQMKIINAANDAFEKSFHDAHDIYHGNKDLAREYWDKFNIQRKSIIEKTLNTEQFAKFQELTKNESFVPHERK